MNGNSFENQKPPQEQLALRIEIATEKDYEAYKKLRIEAVTGSDAQMFGVTPEEVVIEQSRSDSEWKESLSGDDKFIILLWGGTEAIGCVRARMTKEKGVWSLSSGYIKPGFRGQGIGKKMYAAPLREIKKRGGEKVQIGVNIVNEKSLNIAQIFGFKSVIVTNVKGRDWNEMDLDLTNPEVIKKIDEVLGQTSNT
ncbi:MAG TPA: GNAT family N-acetyltransferase [Candidatus Paceibacterota bacterium]|nr:GNAT family N-acetyltransferase [Candidatus Paceibacterota bacterium]